MCVGCHWPISNLFSNFNLRKMWTKLSNEKPKEQKRYRVLINQHGKHIEDTLYWTGKPHMWEDVKVEYWWDGN